MPRMTRYQPATVQALGRFNEAAAVMPRMTRQTRSQQHGQAGRFNEAAAVMPRMTLRRGGPIPAPHPGFNEAAAVMPRMTGRAAQDGAGDHLASTRPRR